MQGAVELAVSKDGSLSSRRVLQSWHGTTIDGWTSPPYVSPMAPAERCSDDEDPFGHGGALDAEEEESDRNKRSGYDSPEEYHTNKLVLGNGVVHHSHETWLLRGITFCGKCGAWGSSAPRLLTKPCT